MKRVFAFLLFIFLARITPAQTAGDISLNGSWEFRMKGDSIWMPATVPGTVHTDLFANKKIPDPFYGDNEKQIQWVEEKDWEYRKIIPLNSEQRKKDRLLIIFEGLDTYAEVWMNGERCASGDNMFHRVVAEKMLMPQDSVIVLTVVFSSASRKGIADMRSRRLVIPGEERVYTRKAQYQYGWDWGPRFVTCGIWRNVYISSDPYWKTQVSLMTDSLTADHEKAFLHLHVSHFYPMNKQTKIIVREKGKKEMLINQPLIANEVAEYKQTCYYAFTINKPRLWYCRGYGAQDFYDFEVLFVNGTDTLMRRSFHTGIREIKIDQTKDAAGSAFTVVLNDIPVFCKGANYIPSDNFLPRVTDEKKRAILTNAVAANMNMIRIWGGGVYETEQFYRDCDSLGLLVWQDLMFACALYPDDEYFMANITKEFNELIPRLTHHPCIAVICNDNEIDEGWHNWGWQKQYNYSPEDSAYLYNSYKSLREFPKEEIKREKWNMYFHPSSPAIGWGHAESLRSGDSHYWGVWWGMEPFEVYEQKVPRFSSEYGFQGIPSLLTLRSVMPDSSLKTDSREMKNHQKHPRGFETIDTCMKREFRTPKDFESYAYVSQILQADGMRKAMEAHHRSQPYCMGSIYWQLNDCWPVVSWSSLDYFLRWKAVHYAARSAFDPVMLSVTERNDSTLIYAVNDLLHEIPVNISWQTKMFSGQTIRKKDITRVLPKASSTLIFAMPTDSFIAREKRKEYFLHVELHFGNGCEYSPLESREAFHYFVPVKDLELPEPLVSWKLKKKDDRYELSVTTFRLAKNIFIDAGDADIHFSDNYFDLSPGSTRFISFNSKLSKKEIEQKLKIRTIRDTYQNP